MAFIEGFKIMKVAFDADVKSPHFMYFKKHTQNKRNELFPADRTIFVVNVPPYCTKRGLENLFGVHGPIQSIFIQDGAGHVHDLSKDEMDFLHMQEHFSFKVFEDIPRGSSFQIKLYKQSNKINSLLHLPHEFLLKAMII